MLSTLPNILTLSRILAVPLLAALMWSGGWFGYALAFGLYAVACATDYLDGYLARAQGTVSKLGVFLDPIADKIMVAAVIVLLVADGLIEGFAVFAALVILVREITVSGLREYLAGLRVSVPVSNLAKWKTAAQMVALGAFLLIPPAAALFPWLPAKEIGLVCLWVAAVLTLVTGYDYLRVGLKHME